ncbi:hypothetical protein CHS0354_025453 [Potamilus streckersoni]|uniref:Uncharacterized protein n=1 Tax=Potamilus streckersoni TaxID=2493646 RepID=A0AAE0RRM1_9BIVA|nr:hypothetical protein CHS0354_025453 [Potamilus streckersoni]
MSNVSSFCCTVYALRAEGGSHERVTEIEDANECIMTSRRQNRRNKEAKCSRFMSDRCTLLITNQFVQSCRPLRTRTLWAKQIGHEGEGLMKFIQEEQARVRDEKVTACELERETEERKIEMAKQFDRKKRELERKLRTERLKWRNSLIGKKGIRKEAEDRKIEKAKQFDRKKGN